MEKMKYITPNWQAPTHIKAYTTLRTSFGDFSHETNTVPPWRESDRLKTLLNIPSEPIWVKQTHSTIAIEANPEATGTIADASYTSEFNRVCVVLTADCLPVLITNTKGEEIAAIHAGWRGLSNGIIESTLNKLKSNPEDLLAWLGPAIGPKKFEVGNDVFDAFTAHCNQAKSAFTPYKNQKWLANLYDLARIILKKLGVQHIYGGEFCTYTEADLFFSYRRDKKTTGRMASLIWIDKS